MTDVLMHAERILREAGYDVFPWAERGVPTLCFENESVLGFIHVFDDVEKLLRDWGTVNGETFRRFSLAFRQAGQKAWNVYTIYLTPQTADSTLKPKFDAVEEDLRESRKIARGGVTQIEDVRMTLLPLLPIQNHPRLHPVNFADEVRRRAAGVPVDALAAFLSEAREEEVALLLETTQ